MVENLRFTHPYLKEVGDYIKDEKVKRMFDKCFFSTVERSTLWDEGEDPFVITGDIPGMWLRDSSAQVNNYIKYVNEVPALDRFINGVIRRQIRNILYDPYANSFNRTENGAHTWYDNTDMKPGVWERKYEIDSICYVIRLIYKYIKVSSKLPLYSETENPGENRDCEADANVGMLVRLFETVLELWTKEQRHFEMSDYRWTREHTWERDTIYNDGLGNPVNLTGMTWSGFRPSDDACIFGYLIPSNFFAAQVLGYMKEISLEYLSDLMIAARAEKLQKQILRGIRNYGTYLHPKYGRIYAYETDGYGNYTLLDDANSPSLLSLPYLSPDVIDYKIYENTRNFVLSTDNPVYYKGAHAEGIGSVHTPEGWIWHIALVMQALTSNDKAEIERIYNILISTDAGTDYMHESFSPENPENFTRAWFSWADSVFAELIMKIYDDESLRDILMR